MEIVVGVIIDCGPKNRVERRELETNIGRVNPCGFIASAWAGIYAKRTCET